VLLVLYDFLDRHTITLCGHLHFMDRGIFIVRRTICTEDVLRTQPELARFMCTPRVPVGVAASLRLLGHIPSTRQHDDGCRF